MRVVVIVLVMLLGSKYSWAQTIELTVRDTTGEDIAYATVLLRDGDDDTKISQFAQIFDGQASIPLDRDYDSLLVEIRCLGFRPHFWQGHDIMQSQSYKIVCTLHADSSTQLKEVTVTANRLPYERSGDTISHDVEAYQDAMDRKIEDVIAKLPGMTVDRVSGIISYEGIPIKTVLLEGDDLFAEDYIIGTRNINTEVIAKVDVIKNYSPNRLLADLQNNSDKVAINLKLKNNKTNLSGSLEGGAGAFANGKVSRNLKATALGISKKMKSFGILSNNNIGVNHGHIDHAAALADNKKSEKKYKTNPLVSDLAFNSFQPGIRSHTNEQNVQNINSVIALHNSLKMHISGFRITDKLSHSKTFSQSYFLPNDTIDVSDTLLNTKSPHYLKGKIKMEWTPNDQSTLVTTFDYSTQDIENRSIVSTDREVREYTQGTQMNYILGTTHYTKRLTPDRAFVATLAFARDKIPQLVSLDRALNETTSSPFSYFQSSEISSNTQETYIGLLGNTKQKLKYELGVGSSNKEYHSTLRSNSQSGSLNDLPRNIAQKSVYRKTELFHLGKWDATWGRIVFQPFYKIRYLSQHLEHPYSGSKNGKKGDFFVESGAKVEYKFNLQTSLSVSYDISQDPLASHHLRPDSMLTSHRLLLNAVPSTHLVGNSSWNITFIRNDLYHQFYALLQLSNARNNNGYISLSDATESFAFTSYKLEELATNALRAKITLRKYIHSLRTAFEYRGTKSLIQGNQRFVPDLLIQNMTNSSRHKLTARTGFDGTVNFALGSEYRKDMITQLGLSSFSVRGLSSDMEVRCSLSDNLHTLLSYRYIVPDLTLTSTIHYVDLVASYTPKKRLLLELQCQNLLGSTSVNILNTSEYIRTNRRIDIIPRNVMLSATFSF